VNGGDLVARVLLKQGVRFLFTLCGGHISPLLVACKRSGIRVVDTRHESSAVFAADAVSRLTGVPGVAAVTAGPGATNAVTAVKAAQLAQSALVLLGGATATALKGRGALQDIDQLALFRPHVKWAVSVRFLRDLIPTLERAFEVARAGLPGPVFVECPVDLLYDESIVRQWYGLKSQNPGGSWFDALKQRYLGYHLSRLFSGAESVRPSEPTPVALALVTPAEIRRAASLLRAAERPVLLVGSQALLRPNQAEALATAVRSLKVPTYLSGMARGLLGRADPLQLRHKRRQALAEADLVLLLGVPCDFRLDYGRHIPRRAAVISVNRSRAEMKLNRRPTLGIAADPGSFLETLAGAMAEDKGWPSWQEKLRQRDREQEESIDAQSRAETDGIHPLALCQEIDRALDSDSLLVADGGDFVASASYIVEPRGPLSWLDPGVFGCLGVGAGFALGSKLARPASEVWILYGDGAAGFSLAELDTFVRHQIPVIAVVGNDAAWTQIAREQIDLLGDDVGTVLCRTAYHRVAEGFGARGLLLRPGDSIPKALQEAKQAAREGAPVLINAHLGRTDFRKGSISM
jgi:acetolactate synthase-1/2/3 large subunit